MPRFKHPTKSKWLRLTSAIRTLTALSDVYQWNAHWKTGERRSYRCTGDDCPLCAEGQLPSERYVVLVEDEKGRAWFLELRERHRPWLEEVCRYRKTFAGTVFKAHKRGEYKTAPVDLTFVEFRERKEIPVGRFVDSLGLDPRQQQLPTDPADR